MDDILREEHVYVQWFPGHMTKTKRLIEKNLKIIDLVVELIDSRIPLSSRNPELNRMIGNKPRVIVFNKCDLADETQTKKFEEMMRKETPNIIKLDCKSGKGINNFDGVIRKALASKLEKFKEKGIKNFPIRLMIVGVPNVGKSSLINRLSKTKRASVEDRPGVTRGKQWISLPGNIDLLDTPGVLWPKFEDKTVGEKLAFCGTVKDDVVDTHFLAIRFIDTIRDKYGDLLKNRFSIVFDDDTKSIEILELIAKKRGMLLKGGISDTERAAIILLDEFRAGKLGRITLDTAEE